MLQTTMSKKEKIRKRLLKSWTKIACGIGYKYAATEETYKNSMQEIEDEMSDGGKLLPLSSRYRNKSINVQKRVLRRIIEKKQSQMAHRFFGHTDNLLTKRIANVFSKRCMKEVSRHQSYDVTPIAHTIWVMATGFP